MRSGYKFNHAGIVSILFTIAVALCVGAILSLSATPALAQSSIGYDQRSGHGSAERGDRRRRDQSGRSEHEQRAHGHLERSRPLYDRERSAWHL